ncbi:MAG: hypothetical protein ACRCX1_12945, partial [Bacteroidales bacterium]
ALKLRDMEIARFYLQNDMGQNVPKGYLYNALGVLAMYEGDEKQAKEYFEKADREGFTQAAENLRILERSDFNN